MVTAKLLEIDRPTSSGRIYPKAIVELALAHWNTHFKTKNMPIFIAPSETPQTKDIVGYAENVRVEDGYLVAEVGFLPERCQEVAKEGETITIRPNGIGSVDTKTGIIREGFKIFGLTIRRHPYHGSDVNSSNSGSIVSGATIKVNDETK